MTDLPTRLRTEAAEHYRSGSKLWLCGIPEGSEMQARALLMRDAADEIERLRAAPLATLDAETIPSVMQVQALADAMWQMLDDMGADSRSVCPATKARARVAYQPFRFTDDKGDDGLDMPLAEAEAILAEVDAPAPSPIVKTEK